MKSLTKIDKAMETMTLCIEAVYDDACKQSDATAEMVDRYSTDAGSAIFWGQVLDNDVARVDRLKAIMNDFAYIKRRLYRELCDVSTEFASGNLKLH